MDKPPNLHDVLTGMCRRYCDLTGVLMSTLGNKMLRDNRALPGIVEGKRSITVRNFEHCMRWLSTYWPEATPWPKHVWSRPEPFSAAERYQYPDSPLRPTHKRASQVAA